MRRALISESIFIRAGSQALTDSSRVYTILYRLIIKPSFVFTNGSFNNRFEYDSCLMEPILSKLASSSVRLHPYPRVFDISEKV